MKVLLITDNHTLNAGGAENHFFTLKAELKKQGIQVHSLGFGLEKKYEQDCTVLTHSSCKIIQQFWRFFLHPVKYYQLRRAIKSIAPDIIHFHNIRKYTPALCAASSNYPVIQTVHDYTPICPTGWNIHADLQPCPTGTRRSCLWQHKRDHSIFEYLARIALFYQMRRLMKKTVRHFIAPSPLLQHYLQANDFKPASYLPPFTTPANSYAAAAMHQNHFLYLGQLEKHKGVDILIREFAFACYKNKNLLLKIAGIGSEESSLKNQIKKAGIEDNVVFLGWIKNPAPLYNACTAVIFPSIGLESFGLVITEAMSHARPVIGSNRGPTSGLVEHQKTGLLFDPLKPHDLADQILMLAANTELSKQLGRKGLEKMTHVAGNAAITSEIIKLYHSLIMH